MPGKESIARLQFGLRMIREKMVDPRLAEQRWFWELRENVTLFALRSLLNSFDDLHEPELSPEEQRAALDTHPLLMPYLPPAISPTSRERQDLQAAMRRKVEQSYLAPALPPQPAPRANGV